MKERLEIGNPQSCLTPETLEVPYFPTIFPLLIKKIGVIVVISHYRLG